MKPENVNPPEIKNATIMFEPGVSWDIAPILLSSDDVVSAIASHVLNVPVVRTSAVVNLDLVDSATGKVVKSISSLSSELISELISDRAVPAVTTDFLQTPKGSTILGALLAAILNFLSLNYLQHSAEVSQQHFAEVNQRKTEQFIKQFLLSHSEQATPTPAHTPPQGD